MRRLVLKMLSGLTEDDVLYLIRQKTTSVARDIIKETRIAEVAEDVRELHKQIHVALENYKHMAKLNAERSLRIYDIEQSMLTKDNFDELMSAYKEDKKSSEDGKND